MWLTEGWWSVILFLYLFLSHFLTPSLSVSESFWSINLIWMHLNLSLTNRGKNNSWEGGTEEEKKGLMEWEWKKGRKEIWKGGWKETVKEGRKEGKKEEWKEGRKDRRAKVGAKWMEEIGKKGRMEGCLWMWLSKCEFLCL